MSRCLPYAAACLLGLGLSGGACALDYRSFAEPGVMYDAPSKRAKPLFVVARHTPVEVIVSLEGWLKVRDAAGDIAWVERRQLSDKRMLIVTAARGQVRGQPDEAAVAVFEAEKDVVLELLESGPPGWARVRHRDGQSGYIRVTQVWGV
jgi:SH3-like domain-containing protein